MKATAWGQRMRWTALISAVALQGVLVLPAEAAWPTHVLTAVEKDHPLPEVWLGVGYEHIRKSANITREWVQRDANGSPTTAEDIRELAFSEYQHRLNIDLRAGIFRDLELHIRAPIILAYKSQIAFADGVEGTSTIWGTDNADDPNYDYRYPITEVPASRERAGFGDMTFGLSWSPFVDAKDEAYPTLTLTGDLIAPTGSRRDPADIAALPDQAGKGGMGQGQTIFDLSVGLSRRMRLGTPALDPYVVLGARIPVATSAQKALGMQPPPSGRAKVGVDVIIHEVPEKEELYSVDLGFSFRYVGIGRTYSELSDYLPNLDQTRVPANRADPSIAADAVTYNDYADPRNYTTAQDGTNCGALVGVPCGELNRVDEHMEMQGSFALLLKPSKWLMFRGGVQVGFVTNHLITAEKVGEDTDPEGSNATCGGSPCAGRVNASNSRGEDERSPYYDPRYDQPGRRLRAEGIFTLTAFANLAITF
ncbi:MAG: hypothetical protein KC933_10695 [Myxococcales bacterium]|nr:hypothetical protein [Myxococcales bacterium]